MNNHADHLGFRLEIPASPTSVATARLFVGAVGLAVGLSAATIDDIKLVVSEAVTAIVERAMDARASLDINAGGTELVVAPLAADSFPERNGVSGLSIIKALFESASIDDAGRRLVVPLLERNQDDAGDS